MCEVRRVGDTSIGNRKKYWTFEMFKGALVPLQENQFDKVTW